MTDNEIIKALECCKMPVGSGACNDCPLKDIRSKRQIDDKSCTTILFENTLDLINRQKADLENYKQIAENQQSVSMDKEVEIKRLKAEVERLEKEGEELQYKLECLLCHSTGGKMSKSTYPLRTMEICVNDTIQDYCEEAQAEAVKEFAERLCEGRVSNDPVVIAVKVELEMVGEDK